MCAAWPELAPECEIQTRHPSTARATSREPDTDCCTGSGHIWPYLATAICGCVYGCGLWALPRERQICRAQSGLSHVACRSGGRERESVTARNQTRSPIPLRLREFHACHEQACALLLARRDPRPWPLAAGCWPTGCRSGVVPASNCPMSKQRTTHVASDALRCAAGRRELARVGSRFQARRSPVGPWGLCAVRCALCAIAIRVRTHPILPTYP